MKGESEPLLVVMTTYSARFGVLRLTVRSLLKQLSFNDCLEIVVYEEDRDRVHDILKDLIDLKVFIRISSVENDMKSYKKFMSSQFPNYKRILTVDDDVYYPRGFISRFKKYHHDEASVFFGRGRRVTGFSYNDWPIFNGKGAPFFTGVGGVSYPRDLYTSLNSDVVNGFKKWPSADDFFANIHSREKDYKLKWIDVHFKLLDWDYKVERLAHLNVDKNANDIHVKGLLKLIND